MSKTKRIIAFVLAAVMSVTMLASCGQVADQPVGNPVDDIPAVSDVPEETDTPEVTTSESTTTEVTTTAPEVTTTEPTTEAPTTTTEAATTTEVSEGYTVEEMSAIMYVSISSLNVRIGPSADYDKLTVVYEGDALTVTGRASTGWYRILIDGKEGFVSSAYVTEQKPDGKVTTATTNNDEEEIIDDDTSSATPSTPSTDSNITPTAWVADNNWDYMYSLFYSDNYRQVMNEVMAGIQNLETQIYVSPLITADELSDFCNLILPILPVKYCYVDDVAATKYTSGVYDGYLKSVKVTYYVNSKAEADKMVSELESAAKKVLKGVKSSMSDYEKILYIHDWLIKNATPDKHNYADTYEDDNGDTVKTEWYGKWGKSIWPNTAYGAIVDGHTTCIGYAKALFYLLGEAGFDCTFAVGVGTSARHIWVKVKCGGSWYNIDPTWDDPCGDTQNEDADYVCYDYFMVTDKFMAATRSKVFDMRFFADPSCTATKYNWYVVNGCYATSLSEAESMLKSQLKKAAATGDKYAYARVKFSSESLYDEFKEKYTKSKATSMLSDITSKYSTVKRIPSTKCLSMTYRISK